MRSLHLHLHRYFGRPLLCLVIMYLVGLHGVPTLAGPRQNNGSEKGATPTSTGTGTSPKVSAAIPNADPSPNTNATLVDNFAATVQLTDNTSVSLYIGANQSIYRFGDVLAATGLRWREDRETIVSSKEFEGSILAEYFSQRATWVAHEVDFQLLYNLCQAPKWKPYAPKENLVIHFRNGDNKFKANETILECAQQFWKTRPRKKKRRGISARLVTIQHYGANEQTGEFFATEESIAQGNAEVTSLIESLQEMKFKVNVQSSQDSDIDFCTLLQADHVCLSKGGFDSVVNAVRDAVGLVHDQSNFEDVPYVQWDKWSLDPDVYNFGKLLVGQGRQDEKNRQYIRDNPDKFKKTVLFKYFKKHKKSVKNEGLRQSMAVYSQKDIDFKLLGDVCVNDTMYQNFKAKDQEHLKLHFEASGPHVAEAKGRVLECAANYIARWKLGPRSHEPPKARLVTKWEFGREKDGEKEGSSSIVQSKEAAVSEKVLAASHIVTDEVAEALVNMGFDLTVQAADADIGFCDLALGRDVCLSTSVTDSVVHAVRKTRRQTLRQTFKQANFEDVPEFPPRNRPLKRYRNHKFVRSASSGWRFVGNKQAKILQEEHERKNFEDEVAKASLLSMVRNGLNASDITAALAEIRNERQVVEGQLHDLRDEQAKLLEKHPSLLKDKRQKGNSGPKGFKRNGATNLRGRDSVES